MKYIYLLIISLVLLNVATANAEGVVLSTENEDIQIKSLDGSATFDLVVLNDDRRERDIFITFPYSPNWRVIVNPYLLRISSKSIGKAGVQVFSLNDRNIGTYELILNIKSRDGSIEEVFPFKVTILPFSGDEVVTQLITPERVDPRVGGVVKLKLENLRKSNMDDLEVVVKSEGIFSERRFLNLKAGEISLQDFEFKFEDTNINPGTYNITAEVKYGNKVVGTSADTFFLAGFTDVVERTNVEGGILRKEATVTKINGGTKAKEEKITITVGGFNKYFTKFDKEPDSFTKVDGKYRAEWNFVLGSGETFSVNVITDYTTLFWTLIVVLLVFIFVYQTKKKKVVISKRVVTVHKDREGISGMKVVLHLTNRSRKAVDDIKLVDLLPSLIGTDPHSFGTLHPTKINKTSLGNIRLTWHIGELHKGEERIISYVARSRLSIIGKLILPSAVVSYKKGNKTIKSKSNKLTLLTAITEMGKES
ncbi:MAG: hypothetical protein Q8Q35_01625 [Nanoarchaeota archaeon]|nr:hypothetical protein [Nanoarchaeota archaeon]